MNGTLTDLNHLLKSDRLFEIPIFQRGYAWEEENLRDPWDDPYYLKTFDHFDVIEGQQRLTTTIILLRKLISQFAQQEDHHLGSGALASRSGGRPGS